MASSVDFHELLIDTLTDLPDKELKIIDAILNKNGFSLKNYVAFNMELDEIAEYPISNITVGIN